MAGGAEASGNPEVEPGMDVASGVATGEAGKPLHPRADAGGASLPVVALTGDSAFSDPQGRRDFWPDTLPPPQKPKEARKRARDAEGAPERPKPPQGMDSTAVRVLMAAQQFRIIHIADGTGGKVIADPDGEMATRPDPELADAFLPERAMVTQINRGWITYTDAANSFTLTDAGRDMLRQYDEFLDRMEQYRQANILHRATLRRQKVQDIHRAEIEGEG